MSIKPFYVEAWSIHFVLCGHQANMYGFKSEQQLLATLSKLDAVPYITGLEWNKTWKETPRGRWHREEHFVR